MKTNGQIAYEAYRDHSKGVSLVSQQPIPEWGFLGAEIKAAWEAAANSLSKHVTQHMPKSNVVPETVEGLITILKGKIDPAKWHNDLAQWIVDAGGNCVVANSAATLYMDRVFGLETTGA